MKFNIFVFCQLCGLCVTCVVGWACLSPIGKTYCKTGTACTIRFNVSAYMQNYITYSIAFYNGKPHGTVIYVNGQFLLDQIPSTNLTEDKSGIIQLTFFSVNSSNAGTYRIDLINSEVPCITVYILDKPAAPTISNDGVPVDGGNITLTCTSNSTTVPRNHSLTMSYSWRVEDVDISVNSRFTYTQSNKSLIISDVQKEDSNLMFSCKATESTGELSSPWSTANTFDVIYGPDAVEINISNIYEAIEGEVVDDISCFCDCFPTCIYHWFKENCTLTDSTELSLGRADRNKAGIYGCTCKNIRTNISKYSSFQLYVKYNCGLPSQNSTSLIVGLTLGSSNVLFLIVTIYLARNHKRSHATKERGGTAAKCTHNTRSATTTYSNVAYQERATSSPTTPYSSLKDNLRSEPCAYDVITS